MLARNSPNFVAPMCTTFDFRPLPEFDIRFSCSPSFSFGCGLGSLRGSYGGASTSAHVPSGAYLSEAHSPFW